MATNAERRASLAAVFALKSVKKNSTGGGSIEVSNQFSDVLKMTGSLSASDHNQLQQSTNPSIENQDEIIIRPKLLKQSRIEIPLPSLMNDRKTSIDADGKFNDCNVTPRRKKSFLLTLKSIAFKSSESATDSIEGLNATI
jgi:hypothetical protein